MQLKLPLLPAAGALAVAAAALHFLSKTAVTAATRVGPPEIVEIVEGDEAVQRGAAAYKQLMKESMENGKSHGCWQHVAEQLLLLQQQTHEDACSTRGEAFRELIALTRLKCIYTRSNRPFPGPEEGCYLFPHEVPQEWLSASGISDRTQSLSSNASS